MIPLIDLRAQHDTIRTEIDEAIKRVIDQSNFIGGEEVESFEREFASYCGKRYAVATSSGTAALHLALLVCKSNGILKAKEEIITTPNTYTATVEPIYFCDAKPIFVDVDDHYLIDVTKVREAITDKTKIILPVHLYGQTANMKELLELAEEKNLIVIEDACQAHGAEHHEKKTPISETGCFSFFPSKPLGALGDAGAIVTDNEELANKAKQLRDHGRADRAKSKYEHAIIGLNYRLDALKAAVLRVKLKHLDKWNDARRKNASLYNKYLSELPLELPKEMEGNKHVYYVYTIRTKERDKLAAFLKEHGIATQIYYPLPLHLQEAYTFLNHKEGDFPITEKHAKEILSLPMYPKLTEEQIDYIYQKVKGFFKVEQIS